MSSVQSTDTQSVVSTTMATVNAKKKVEDQQDRFLKLLVAQVKNQDPLKPMDNAEMTSQMAQISTVSGIEKLNTTLQQLVSSSEDRSMEAAGLIGHQVFVPGSLLSLDGDSSVFGIELAQPIDNLKVKIFDSAGVVVRQLDLGAYPAGISRIPWDGKADNGSLAAPGDYTFKVESAKQGSNEVKVDTLSRAKVNSVIPGEDNTLLDMGKALGLVSLADIKQVF